MVDADIAAGAGGVRIEGLSRTLRALSKAGADAQDMRDLMHDIGQIVVAGASPPRRLGLLAGTVRAGRGKTKAVIRAGSAKVPYANPIHWGWPARGIPRNPFLTDSLQRNRPAAIRRLEDGIDNILKTNNLR